MYGNTWFTGEVVTKGEFTGEQTIVVSLNLAHARSVRWAAGEAIIAFPANAFSGHARYTVRGTRELDLLRGICNAGEAVPA